MPTSVSWETITPYYFKKCLFRLYYKRTLLSCVSVTETRVYSCVFSDNDVLNTCHSRKMCYNVTVFA